MITSSRSSGGLYRGYDVVVETNGSCGDLAGSRAHIISRVLEIAEKNNDTILYAQ